MILPDPTLGLFRANRPLRAMDMRELVEGINRAGRIIGSGRAYGGNGFNPTVHVPELVPTIKGFWGKIYIPSGGDYTDERYQIKRQRLTGGTGWTAQLTDEDDTPADDGEDWPLTATNRAELQGHTHSLADGTEVWVTAEWDYSDTPSLHYSFALSPPGGLAVHDCADAGGPATIEKFAGGFTVAFVGSTANVSPNFIPDPANPGVSIVNGNGAICGPIKLGLDCTQVIQDVSYTGGVFYKKVCGVNQVVFSTTACPTGGGVSPGEFFAYQP